MRGIGVHRGASADGSVGGVDGVDGIDGAAGVGGVDGVGGVVGVSGTGVSGDIDGRTGPGERGGGSPKEAYGVRSDSTGGGQQSHTPAVC